MIKSKEFVQKRKEAVKKITEQFYIREKANKLIKIHKKEMEALDRAMLEGYYD